MDMLNPTTWRNDDIERFVAAVITQLGAAYRTEAAKLKKIDVHRSRYTRTTWFPPVLHIFLPSDADRNPLRVLSNEGEQHLSHDDVAKLIGSIQRGLGDLTPDYHTVPEWAKEVPIRKRGRDLEGRILAARNNVAKILYKLDGTREAIRSTEQTLTALQHEEARRLRELESTQKGLAVLEGKLQQKKERA